MKLQVGNYYLNAGGEIRKIIWENNNKRDIYRYWDVGISYTSDGIYDIEKQTENDLIMEVPKDKLKSFIEGLIND